MSGLILSGATLLPPQMLQQFGTRLIPEPARFRCRDRWRGGASMELLEVKVRECVSNKLRDPLIVM